MNEIVKCKDCKWWDKFEDCPIGNCKDKHFVQSCPHKSKDSKKNDYLWYYDYDEFAAYFRTGANFGCVHGEKKEDKS